MDETEKEVHEKTYRFLLTTARRDGVKRIFIGVVSLHEGMQKVHIGEMEDEHMEHAIKRIAEQAGLKSIKIKRYLGKFDLNLESDPIRQFNFEIK